MTNIYNCLKKMMPVAESLGDIMEVSMEYEWLEKYDRIAIAGETNSGRRFELKLEIDKPKEENNA